jgi:hypothetical protein
MWTWWQELWALMRAGIDDVAGTDVGQVRYADPGLARSLGWMLAIVVLVTLVRVVVGRRKHSRVHSGHVISRRHQRGHVIRLVAAVPKAALAVAVVLMLVAAAGPFLPSTEEYAGSVDSRLRVDLIDVSGSMGWEFPGTQKSKAQVAREAYLNFLEMRRGKNDRVSLWLFSSYPYMVDDFVTDDELYYFQALDAPYMMTQAVDRAMMVPADKVRIVTAEGDSNILRPLQAIIRQLDAEEASSGRGRRQARALLVITDAAVSELPEHELAELNARNVVPYVLYINATDPRFAGMLRHEGPPPLVERIRSVGGDYFEITDPRMLSKAYEAIDAREAVRYEVRHRALTVPIHTRFLVASLALLLIVVPGGLLAELLWGTYP